MTGSIVNLQVKSLSRRAFICHNGSDRAMPVPFKCSNCGFETKVKDELTGKRIKCPKCQTVGQVGTGTGTAAPAGSPGKKKKPSEEESSDGLMSVNLDSFQDAEVPEGEVLDESQPAPKPKAKKKKKGASLDPQVKVAAIGFSLLSILVLAGIIYLGGPIVMEKYKSYITPADAEAGGKPAADGAAQAPAAQ